MGEPQSTSREVAHPTHALAGCRLVLHPVADTELDVAELVDEGFITQQDVVAGRQQLAIARWPDRDYSGRQVAGKQSTPTHSCELPLPVLALSVQMGGWCWLRSGRKTCWRP